jgi:hypothetical protein
VGHSGRHAPQAMHSSVIFIAIVGSSREMICVYCIVIWEKRQKCKSIASVVMAQNLQTFALRDNQEKYARP